MNYLEHEIVEVVLPLFMATTMLWMWDRMILPACTSPGWAPCKRASNQAAWICSYRAPGRRSAFGWSILGEGLGSPDAGVRGAFPRWFRQGSNAGVSIIFKIRVFYKAWFRGFEFFIGWPYAVFHKMQVVFYKKWAFYVFLSDPSPIIGNACQ